MLSFVAGVSLLDRVSMFSCTSIGMFDGLRGAREQPLGLMSNCIARCERGVWAKASLAKGSKGGGSAVLKQSSQTLCTKLV